MAGGGSFAAELFQPVHWLQNLNKIKEDGQISNQSSTSELPGGETSLSKGILWAAAPELETFIPASTISTCSTLLTQQNMAQFQAPLRLSNFKHLLMFVESPEGSWSKRSPRQPRGNKIQTPSNHCSARQEAGMETEKGKGERWGSTLPAKLLKAFIYVQWLHYKSTVCLGEQ